MYICTYVHICLETCDILGHSIRKQGNRLKKVLSEISVIYKSINIIRHVFRHSISRILFYNNVYVDISYNCFGKWNTPTRSLPGKIKRCWINRSSQMQQGFCGFQSTGSSVDSISLVPDWNFHIFGSLHDWRGHIMA